jgi:hypothetical protein
VSSPSGTYIMPRQKGGDVARRLACEDEELGLRKGGPSRAQRLAASRADRTSVRDDLMMGE